jgi:PAS domain S-box-containing protein
VSPVTADAVLLVAGDAAAVTAGGWRGLCAAANAGCHGISVAELEERLPAGHGEAPAVALLLPCVKGALALARRMHGAWPDAYLLIVRREAELAEFRRSMGVAPLLGRHWSVTADHETEVAAALRQSLASARQQRQLRTTLARGNARWSEPRAVAPADYQRMVASEHHLSNFLRYSDAAVLGLDAAGQVLFWSEGAAQLLGVPAREVLGRPLESLGDWGEAIARAARDAGTRAGQHILELPLQLRGTPKVLEAMATTTGAGSREGSGTSIVLRDVTARRQAQDQLRDANLQLQRLVSERTEELEKSQLALLQAQKLEALGKLTGGVAHDFNNVLQVIGSNLQLVQPLVDDRPQAGQLLRAALGAVERGAKLSSQLLAFARRQPLDPVPLDIGRKLRGMDDLLRRALGERIEVELAVAARLWTTLADGSQLENVVLNLAINARDAMPEGGKLTLEAGNMTLDDAYTADVPDLAPGQYVMLAVSDTGQGMPPEVVAQAFEPFFTTKPEGQGTGLGLSMAYGFAKQSGGHIRIYSEVGHGTTIRLYLPRSFEKEIVPPPVSAGPVQGGDETVLVVEDDAAVQAAVVHTLQSLGYRVLRASDAQAGLTILQSGAHVDVLVTDVVMPGSLRSPELAQRARQLVPGIAVLFTSGYTENAIVHGGRLDPGVELLSKPYRQEDLARKLRHVLSRRQPVRDERATARPPEAAPAPPPDRALRVLLVEDDPDLREVSQQMLEILGCEVRTAASAEQAQEVLGQARFDLLLTDYSLPGRNGAELAKHARTVQPGLVVVISSGYGETAAEAGSQVLPKPYGMPELQALLDTVKAPA